MRFSTTIRSAGKTATGIAVPAEIVTALGSGKRPAVRVTLGEHTYRTTVAPMGGEFLIPVSAEVREKAGVAAGDAVDVEIELDTEPREVTVPQDLAEALDGAPSARRRFDALSYSNKRRYVLAVEGAKAPETRRRRIDKTITELNDDRP
ncbi:YdeI/OmpD-associated family protein [Sphaerisporangium corydalis]|uniref:YdeI/OmpD-associated family protein n=1 Tax=Sphaerisporangium corydalis TaxID=1441875 RepID=A0ABV9EI70_9ACTN|nr:YdeI/OmpD-associated family protein [Sphaerisporangium corydalis]